MRSLDIWLDDRKIGALKENQGIWSLAYEAEWVEAGFPLAPGLPLQRTEIIDTGSSRPVQWFFDNLLPEDAARDRLIRSLPKGNWDAWALLERFGIESAGAITLLEPGATIEPEGLKPLSDVELNSRILDMPRTPLGSRAPKKMSLAGAQEKILVCIDKEGGLFEPVGASASTHILKPDVLSELYPTSAVNEWFCARVASKLKLPVPAVRLRHVPSAVYLIERFDRRVMADGRVTRLHAIDVTQLLTLGAGAKYSESGIGSLLKVIEFCRIKANTRVRLFQWMLFNVLIGNGDAHLKNLSLLADKSGYVLSSHYDLVSTAAWATPGSGTQSQTWPAVDLPFPVGRATQFGTITRADLIDFGEQLGLPDWLAGEIIDTFAARMPIAADEVILEHGAMAMPPETRAAETRMLRSIRHLPIADMCRQLASVQKLEDGLRPARLR